MSNAAEHAVAIVGMAARFPGAADLAAYWNNVCSGVDAIAEVPATRWDRSYYDADAGPRPDRFYCKRGGFLAEPLCVDAAAFGIMPVAAEGAEPDQLLALQAAAAALADAGLTTGAIAGMSAAVILGRGGYLTPAMARLNQRVQTAAQLRVALRGLLPELSDAELDRAGAAFAEAAGSARPDAAIGLVPNLAASRIANRLDLHGPAYTVDAACASSLVAIDHGVAELARRRCDVVVAGGVHLCQDVTFWSVFNQLGALSRSQQIRPFDRRADGLLIGEGVGVVVLKRLADAERDGDRIYATIAGVGVASDGRGGGLMKPSVDGQLRALQAGWKEAGLDPHSVGYVEAHGTATPVGDAAELETLGRFFGRDGDAGLGSVKSMIGHTMPAAGIAGLIKAALAVYHGELPPTLHCEQPHPDLDKTRFRLVRERRVWNGGRPRHAAVNAFGFGGINAHVVLAQHGSGKAHKRQAPSHERLRLVEGKGAAGGRLAVLDPTPERLATAQKIVARGKPWRGRKDIWFVPRGLLADGGKVALLFPGIEAVFEPRTDDVADWFGWAPPAAAGDTPLERHGTHLVAVGRLLDRALRRLGIAPDVIAGHSVGEWTAMITSEMIPSDQIDRFVSTLAPGELQTLDVSFVAVGCGADTVHEVIADFPDVCVSHDNCPHQAIMCGPQGAIDGAVDRLRARKVLCQTLPFRSGFHTPLYADSLAFHRRNFARLPLQPASVPVWSATTCAPYPTDEAQTRELLVRHLVEPVRFRALIEALYADGVRVFLSAGPSASLPGFVEDTLRGKPHLAMAANSAKRTGLSQLARVAAAVWAEGGDVNLAALPVDVSRDGANSRGVTLDLSVPLIELPPVMSRPSGGRAGEGGQSVRQLSPATALTEWQTTYDQMVAAHRDILHALQHQPQPRTATTRRTLSIDTEPQLLDHCFYRQPDGAAPVDRFPVVPMTMNLELMIDAATRLVPDKVAVALERITAYRWLAVSPAVDIDITASFDGRDRVDVRIGDFASGTVVLADAYPSLPAPALQLRDEAPSQVTGEQLYANRWMFHGPAYQGVTAIDAVAADGIRGQLRSLAASGGLLDNAGQLFGYWVMTHVERDVLAFPVRIGRIDFAGSAPAVGATTECRVRITEVTAELVSSDMELLRDGRLWARISGWVDKRFDTDDVVWPMLRFPEDHGIARADADGNWIAVEHWRGAASRELIARRYLDADERQRLDAMGLRRRRGWLLGRIAIKDAVRQLLWAQGHGPMFPIEVHVDNDADGRPQVRGPNGRSFAVSVAHKADIAIARVADSGAVGVDIERIEARSDGFADIAFSPAERSLRGGADRDEWLTRVWAAKEAVAKLRGTGLQGNPRRFEVTEVAGERLLVDGVWVVTRRHDDYIIAWSEQ